MKGITIIWLFVIALSIGCFGEETEERKPCCQKNGATCSCASQLYLKNGKPEICNAQKTTGCLNMDDCLIKKTEESECHSHIFEGNTNDRNLGLLRLHPVVMDFATNLNMTFINVTWNRLDIRVRGMERNWTICRTIELNDQVVKELQVKELFYSCRLFSAAMIDQDMMLEYHATDGVTNEYGRFSFRLESPADKLNYAAKWRNKFVYIEWQLPLLVARWHHPRGEGPAVYKMSVKRDEKIWQENLILSGNSTCVADPGMEVRYDTMHIPGEYVFAVTKVCEPEHDCNSVSLVSVKIAPVSRVLQYVSLGFLFVQSILVLIILWMSAQWYRALSGTPKVLVMYSPSRCAHVKAVKELVSYLREQCRVNVLFDLEDIKVSDDPDPVRWYNKSLEMADSVLMIASPPPPGIPDKMGYLQPALHLEHGAAEVFVDLDLLSMKLLAPNLTKRKPRIIACLPPGTNIHCLPPEIRNFHCYDLPRQLGSMLRGLRGVGPRLPCLPPPPGAETATAEARNRVWSAMKAAHKDLIDKPSAPGSLSPWERPSSVEIMQPLNHSVIIPIKDESLIPFDIWPLKVCIKNADQKNDINIDSFPGPLEAISLLGVAEDDAGTGEQQEDPSQQTKDLGHNLLPDLDL